MQRYLSASKLLTHVTKFGFCRFDADSNQISELIQSLRKHRFSVSNTSLQIWHALDARPNTLSKKYGTAAFPFHTDFAFRAMPPRYILLVNNTDMHFQRPTLVARIDLLTPALRNLVRNSMWKLVSSKKHYLVSGQFIRDGQVVW